MFKIIDGTNMYHRNNVFSFICLFVILFMTQGVKANTVLSTESHTIVESKSTSLNKLIKINGVVIDEKGNTIPGVSVSVKNTTIGTYTDIDGKFTLDVKKGDSLIISLIGFEDVVLKVGNKTSLKIVMKESRQQLQEVVVTGFQTIAKERATGSYNLIKQKDLDKPAIDLSSKLVTSVSGIQATVNDDGKADFTIRGKTSLNANAQPLVVVDGFPIEGDFSSLNPNTVKSVTILKDAAAASIWGARAANGVIVVTTKEPMKSSPIKVSLNMFTRFKEKIDLDYSNPIASSADQLRYEELAYGKWGGIIPTGGITDVTKKFTKGLIALWKYDKGMITAKQRDAIRNKLSKIDYRDDVYKYLLQNPIYQQYNLSISGATDKMGAIVNFLFEDNKSHYVGTNSKKYQIDSKIRYELAPWLDLKISTMLQYSKSNNNGVNSSDIRGLSPYENLVNSDGSYNSIVRDYFLPTFETMPLGQFPYKDWSYNPLREIRNRDLIREKVNTRINAGLTFKIIKGLTYNTNIQYEMFTTKDRNLYKEDSYYVRNSVNSYTDWDRINDKVLTNHVAKGDILSKSSSEVLNYTFRNTMRFTRLLGTKHRINATAGFDISQFKYTSTYGQDIYGYNDKTLSRGSYPNGIGGYGHLALHDWRGQNASIKLIDKYSYTVDKFVSMYAVGSYTFNDKYSLSASIRTDASNLITDDPSFRYSPFWSVGGSWNMSQEKFMKNITFVNFLKLYASYGYSGNIDKSTGFKPLISLGSSPSIYSSQNMAWIGSYGNPSLRWEKTGTFNLGLNYSLFGSKLFGKIEVYRKHGEDLIANISMPVVNGTSEQKFNNAEILNQGIELEIGYRTKILNTINWETNLAYSYNKNEVLKLFVANYTGKSLVEGNYMEGKDASTIWGYEYVGIKNGQPSIKGANGQVYPFGQLVSNTIDGRKYCKEVGVRTAPHTMAFTNNFNYKNFDLGIIITGKFGHVFKKNYFNYPDVRWDKVSPNNLVSEAINSDGSIIPSLPQSDNEPKYYLWSSYFSNLSNLWEDASHIRFQEISLAYNLHGAFVKSCGISNVRFSFQINNIGVLAFNKDGIDPEFPMGSFGKPTRAYTFGIKLDF